MGDVPWEPGVRKISLKSVNVETVYESFRTIGCRSKSSSFSSSSNPDSNPEPNPDSNPDSSPGWSTTAIAEPRGIAYSRDVGLIVADAKNDVLLCVDVATGSATVWAGAVGDARCVDGALSDSAINSPCGVVAEDNTIFVVSPVDNTLRMVGDGASCAAYLEISRKWMDIAGVLVGERKCGILR